MNGEENLQSSPIESVHWTELKGNIYSHDIQLGMLLEGGIQVRKVTIKKTDYNGMEPYPMMVTFDRSFVIKKLSKALSPLKAMGWNELMKLISEAVKSA